MKVVINTCYGGFSISKECAQWMAEHGHQQSIQKLDEWKRNNEAVQQFLSTGSWPQGFEGKGLLEIDAQYKREASFYGYYIEDRADPLLVQAVEALGIAANGECAKLKIVEIPDGVDYDIDYYDGMESIHERHRSWT